MPVWARNVVTLCSMMSPSVAPRVDTCSSTPLLTTVAAAVTGVGAFAALAAEAAVACGVVEVAGWDVGVGAWRQACTTGIAAARQNPTTNRRRLRGVMILEALPGLSVEPAAAPRQASRGGVSADPAAPTPRGPDATCAVPFPKTATIEDAA